MDDDLAILRAAEITLRRAIAERFPPGRERDERLRWVESLVARRVRLTRGSDDYNRRRGPVHFKAE